MSLMLNDIVISGEYRVSYTYYDSLVDSNVLLEEIENDLYKFSKLEPEVSERELLVLSSNDYDTRWVCNNID